MTEIEKLIKLSDLEWFNSMCETLMKKANPTTHKIMNIIGVEKPNLNNEIRGSKFLDTHDKRFHSACINPNLINGEADQPLDYLSFWGDTFSIKIGDIAKRFENFKIQTNTYDGGTQIFFYPVPDEYEFTAIDCWTKKDENEISNLMDLCVKGVAFKFGKNLVLGRDGYSMKRKIGVS